MGVVTTFLKDQCEDLILVDFTAAVFVARHNLKDAENILYFMGDLKKLPFQKDFVDYYFVSEFFIICQTLHLKKLDH